MKALTAMGPIALILVLVTFGFQELRHWRMGGDDELKARVLAIQNRLAKVEEIENRLAKVEEIENRLAKVEEIGNRFAKLEEQAARRRAQWKLNQPNTGYYPSTFRTPNE